MSGTTLDATDLMLLQFPEMWDSPTAYRDITTYGSDVKTTMVCPVETYYPECDKCNKVDKKGLRPICDNTEQQEVLYVCCDCYKKTCCDRCEQSTIVNKYKLTFAHKTTAFTLCYDCYDMYKHADEDEEE
jgi:hypothetical protein